ncbi:hypothetical protein JIN84_21820 [Luteolibacter yonseiensis]|uniref:Uncharacterized protein n=1 Tax=Luteolibacter yonseiensis TaxID=1144680 RepID=A0A934RAQ7_9BACT|nr:hypothetical protein [Luteolibacter yonseiensis]MBK1818275.1 hypothetical protein [Luteolibacter yonseiensis]
MSTKTIRIAAEVILVLGTAGLLLELVAAQSWAVILLGVAAVAWLQVRRH